MWPSVAFCLAHAVTVESGLAATSYEQVFADTSAPRFTDRTGVLQLLFGWETDGPLHHLSVKFVGNLVWESMRHLLSRELDESEFNTIDDFLELAKQAAQM